MQVILENSLRLVSFYVMYVSVIRKPFLRGPTNCNTRQKRFTGTVTLYYILYVISAPVEPRLLSILPCKV
jgi:hypothetical protein